MTWPNQHPPAIDVILHHNVPCAGYGAASPCYLEIDKLSDGRYRATVGTLFEYEGNLPDGRSRSAGAASQPHDRLPVL